VFDIVLIVKPGGICEFELGGKRERDEEDGEICLVKPGRKQKKG
jgi:hypothetical protein